MSQQLLMITSTTTSIQCNWNRLMHLNSTHTTQLNYVWKLNSSHFVMTFFHTWQMHLVFSGCRFGEAELLHSLSSPSLSWPRSSWATASRWCRLWDARNQLQKIQWQEIQVWFIKKTMAQVPRVLDFLAISCMVLGFLSGISMQSPVMWQSSVQAGWSRSTPRHQRLADYTVVWRRKI